MNKAGTGVAKHSPSKKETQSNQHKPTYGWIEIKPIIRKTGHFFVLCPFPFRRWSLLMLNGAVLVFVIWGGHQLLGGTPRVEASNPSWRSTVSSDVEVIEWEFDKPVNMERLKKYISHEELEELGKWEFDQYWDKLPYGPVAIREYDERILPLKINGE